MLFLECSNRVTTSHARGRFAVANIDTVDALHISYKCRRIATIWECSQIERPIHIQVSLADTEFVKIITVYEPNEDEWIDYSKRR